MAQITVKERIVEYANSKNILNKELEAMLGYKNGGFNNIKEFSAEKVSNLLRCNPELSAEYIMRGTMPMLLSSHIENIENSYNTLKIEDNSFQSENTNTIYGGNASINKDQKEEIERLKEQVAFLKKENEELNRDLRAERIECKDKANKLLDAYQQIITLTNIVNPK